MYFGVFLSIVIILTTVGCGTKVYEVELMSDSKIDKVAKVAVVPFTGEVYLRSVASEWFTHGLQKKLTNTIISPAMVEKNLSKHSIALGLKQEQYIPLQTEEEFIRSQQSERTLFNEAQKYQAHIFSTEDLVRIGQKLDVDIVISGSVTEVSFAYGRLVELRVIDIKKGSLVAVFIASNELYNVKDIVYAIEKIIPDVLRLFSSDKEVER